MVAVRAMIVAAAVFTAALVGYVLVAGSNENSTCRAPGAHATGALSDAMGVGEGEVYVSGEFTCPPNYRPVGLYFELRSSAPMESIVLIRQSDRTVLLDLTPHLVGRDPDRVRVAVSGNGVDLEALRLEICGGRAMIEVASDGRHLEAPLARGTKC